MIARIWHGTTAIEHFEEYTELMKTIAIPDYSKTPGFKDLTFLRSKISGVAHFTLITYWDNLEVIKKFAGEDYTKAKYYPEDRKYLLEFEAEVAHHEVFS